MTSFSVDAAVAAAVRSFQRVAPVDVVGIANEIGLEVWEDHLDGISGKLFRDSENGGESGYSIVVNSVEPFTRKRFTIAHEIGHFVLHRDELGAGVEDDVFYRSSLSNAMEAQANRFAADLLMPYSLIEQLQAAGHYDVSEMADMLQVSQQALKIRLGIPVVD